MSYKKAQLAQLGMICLISLMFFMAGMIALNLIKDSVTDARTNLSCSSASTISDGTKLVCLLVDGTVPYFIISVFAIAGGMIVTKFAI